MQSPARNKGFRGLPKPTPTQMQQKMDGEAIDEFARAMRASARRLRSLTPLAHRDVHVKYADEDGEVERITKQWRRKVDALEEQAAELRGALADRQAAAEEAIEISVRASEELRFAKFRIVALETELFRLHDEIKQLRRDLHDAPRVKAELLEARQKNHQQEAELLHLRSALESERTRRRAEAELQQGSKARADAEAKATRAELQKAHAESAKAKMQEELDGVLWYLKRLMAIWKTAARRRRRRRR